MKNIKNLWIKLFGIPETFLCNNETPVANLLSNNKDPEIPVLFMEDIWVTDFLKDHHMKFTEVLLRIKENSNCPDFYAVLWASSIVNATSLSGKPSPALNAFGFIPLLPCIGGYKPPEFCSKQRFEKK